MENASRKLLLFCLLYSFNYHIILVLIPDKANPGFSLAQGDGISVFIHIISRIRIGIAGPGPLCHPALGEHLHLHPIISVQAECQVVVLIPYFSVAVLKDYIIIGQLISGALIDLRAAVLETIILSVFLIIFKAGFHSAVSVSFPPG